MKTMEQKQVSRQLTCRTCKKAIGDRNHSYIFNGESYEIRFCSRDCLIKFLSFFIAEDLIEDFLSYAFKRGSISKN